MRSQKPEQVLACWPCEGTSGPRACCKGHRSCVTPAYVTGLQVTRPLAVPRRVLYPLGSAQGTESLSRRLHHPSGRPGAGQIRGWPPSPGDSHLGHDFLHY